MRAEKGDESGFLCCGPHLHSGNIIISLDSIVSTGCLLCPFGDFKINSGLWPLSVSPRCQCVYTMVGQTPALKQNLLSSERS